MELQDSGRRLAWHTSIPLNKELPPDFPPAWHLTGIEGVGGFLSWEKQGEGHLFRGARIFIF